MDRPRTLTMPEYFSNTLTGNQMEILNDLVDLPWRKTTSLGPK